MAIFSSVHVSPSLSTAQLVVPVGVPDSCLETIAQAVDGSVDQQASASRANNDAARS